MSDVQLILSLPEWALWTGAGLGYLLAGVVVMRLLRWLAPDVEAPDAMAVGSCVLLWPLALSIFLLFCLMLLLGRLAGGRKEE